MQMQIDSDWMWQRFQNWWKTVHRQQESNDENGIERDRENLSRLMIMFIELKVGADVLAVGIKSNLKYYTRHNIRLESRFISWC